MRQLGFRYNISWQQFAGGPVKLINGWYALGFSDQKTTGGTSITPNPPSRGLLRKTMLRIEDDVCCSKSLRLRTETRTPEQDCPIP